MTSEEQLKSEQRYLDELFERYKIAALTGMLSRWNMDDKFDKKHARMLAVMCDMVAREMYEMHVAGREK